MSASSAPTAPDETLRALAGFCGRQRTIAIGGHDIAADAIGPRRLAFMPDEPHLFEYLTVDEHLRLTARLYAVPDFDARARALIDELELTGKERALPGELSRGMRQKVVIACGLVRDASVLLFDEPLTGLDPIGIRKMRATIVARGRAGAAILVSSHLLHLVEICTRVVIMIAARKWPTAPSPSLRRAPKPRLVRTRANLLKVTA